MQSTRVEENSAIGMSIARGTAAVCECRHPFIFVLLHIPSTHASLPQFRPIRISRCIRKLPKFRRAIAFLRLEGSRGL